MNEPFKLPVNKVPRVDFDGYMKARDVDVANVKTAEQFRDEIIEKLHGGYVGIVGTTLPWQKTFDQFRFRRGEVTTWLGFNGSYKSMLTGFVLLDQINQGEKVCIASFEMKPQTSLTRLVRQGVGTDNPSLEYTDKFFDWAKKSLWFYDQQGTVKADRIIAVIYYCAEQLGITQFIVDSLMKCIPDEDDMNGQKRFVDRLCAAAQDLNIHIHLVHHSRKKENENSPPGKQDAKGSGSISDQTDNLFVVFKIPEERKHEGETDPDVMLYCLKQRNGELIGKTALWFERHSLQFHERPGAPVMRIVP